MLNLLNFFEDATAGAEGGAAAQGGGWLTWVILGVMVVLMIVMMIVPQRKQKKAQEEMQAKLGIGVTIMTIGGIIGEIVKMEGEHVWLSTGLDEQKCILKFTNRAIHSIVTVPENAVDAKGEPIEEVVDEIK